jgi:lipopolysaccharide biosynthesis glycosyltransferase
MNIAFCINRFGLIGLAATVTSLIRNCSVPENLTLYFICAHLTPCEKHEIATLLKSENFAGTFNFIDFNPTSEFSGFPSLHGDWTPYGILLLSDLIKENRVLYLDSDLVVELDVLEIRDFDFEGKAIAAVAGGKIKTQYSKDFYINKAGLSPELDSFNSGVVLFNLEMWKAKEIKKKCFKVAEQFTDDLVSHDQSILNAVFAGEFSKLPSSYNCEWPTNYDRPTVASKMIIHFVGSPKPWDFLGFLIHKGFKTWKMYSNKEWEQDYSAVSIFNFKRTWNLRRSYLRVISEKIKGLPNLSAKADDMPS